jgi:hypothetical protein
MQVPPNAGNKKNACFFEAGNETFTNQVEPMNKA